MKLHAFIAVAALAAASAWAGASDTVQGEVRRVDKSAKKITLKHGELKNLGMPPMTMAFAVKDPALLEKVKQGDTVSFTVEKAGSSYTVTMLEPVK